MLRSVSLFILICLCWSCSQWKASHEDSQNQEIDRLQSLTREGDIRQKKETLRKLDSMLLLSKNIPDSLLAENYYLKAEFLESKSQRDSAAIYYHRAIDHIDSIQLNPRIQTYFTRGWKNDLKIHDEANATSLVLKLIKLCDVDKDHKTLFLAYNALERINRKLYRYEEQFKYNTLAYEMAVKTKDTANQSIERSTRAEVLAGLGRIKEAYAYLQPFLNTESSNGDHANAMLFNSYGIVQYYDNAFKASVDSYKNSLYYIKQNTSASDRTDRMAWAYCNIGESYRALGQRTLEYKYMDSAINAALKSGAPRTINYVSRQHLQTSYPGTKIVQEISAQFDTLVKYQYANYDRKIKGELTDLSIANEKEKELLDERQKQEIASIQFRNKVIAAGAISALLLLLGYVFYQRRTFKFARQELQMQQRLLRSQMNPHFTFNTLSTIQNQIESEPEKASNYLIKFSRLLRLILENSTSNYILLEKEVDSLRKYMDLQKLRFPKKFEYEFVFDNVEEDEFIFIPPMLMQPFVENCIEHGFSGITYKGQIIITLSRPTERDRAGKQNYIQCTIDDNGKGIQESNSELKQSLSTTLISSFLKDATKSKLEITNKEDIKSGQKGMRIQFLIPFKYTDDD